MRDDPHYPQARSAVLVRRLVRDFIWRHWRRIALAFLCMGLAGGSTALRAWLMEPVLDRIFIARDSSLLLLIAGAALALAVVKSLADYGQTVLMSRVGQRVITDVQTALFARLMRADLAYFNAHPSGVLISRFMNDVWLLRNAAANVLAGIGSDAVTVVFLIGVMFYQDWSLALVAFLAFPLAIRPIVRIGRRMRRVSANTQVEMGQLTTLLNQTFQGARHVKAYGMEEYEERRAGGSVRAHLRLIDRANRTRSRAGADDGGARRRGDRDGDPLWRPPGDRRRAHAGRVLLVHHRAAARLPAGEEPGDPERLAAGGAGRGAAGVRGARHRAGDPRPAGRAAAARRRAARCASTRCASAISPARSRSTASR